MTIQVQMVFGFNRVRFDQLYEAHLGQSSLEGRGKPINLGRPAEAINCVNCGAPLPIASSVCCDYCGSHQ